MPPTVEVTAPSRLHFGLFTFGEGPGPRFGGVGAMIAEPLVRVRASHAERFSASGRYPVRSGRFARTYAESFGLPEPPACRLEVVDAPDEHHGLGLGTQLGMAIAASLATIEGRGHLSAPQLAIAVGRGVRSAVGAYGFRHGGLILDGGKAASDPLGRLDACAALPAEWRFVLARPESSAGLAGVAESDAFGHLPPPPEATTTRLRDLAQNELLPAAGSADFARFSAALHEYNVTAGECFAAVQGGPFASPAIAGVVARLQSLGCVGCGQSSWGPTVFGLAASQEEADSLATGLLGDETLKVAVTAINNHGAKISAADIG